MCLGAKCGDFFKENVKPRQFKCPCGYSYWDIFQDFYLEPQHRKIDRTGRAVPMEAEEDRKKIEFDAQQFEAGLRTQFILHCIRCGVKARLHGDSQILGFDDEGLPRVLTELFEISQGDLQSRGLSATIPSASSSILTSGRADAKSQVRSSETGYEPARSSGSSASVRSSNVSIATLGASHTRGVLTSELNPISNRVARSPPSQRTAEYHSSRSGVDTTFVERMPVRSRHRVTSSTNVLPVQGSGRSHQSPVSRSDEGDNEALHEKRENIDDPKLQSRSAAIEGSTSGEHLQSDPEDESRQSRSMSLPAAGISYEVLEYHQGKGTFGTWKKIRRTFQKNSRGQGEKEVFIIDMGSGTSPLNTEQIRRIIKESAILEEARRRGLESSD